MGTILAGGRTDVTHMPPLKLAKEPSAFRSGGALTSAVWQYLFNVGPVLPTAGCPKPLLNESALPVVPTMSGAIFLVQLPPPVHGMSVINKAVIGEVAEQIDTEIVDLSFNDLNVSWRNIIKNALAFSRAVCALLSKSTREYRWVYICASGGSRQFLDLLIVLIAKMRGFRVCVHHHSFRYINVGSPLIAALYGVLGSSDLSIFLGERHAREFAARYKPSTHNICMSNAAFIEGPQVAATVPLRAGTPLRVGFMSNIELTKGIDTYIATVRALKERSVPITAVVAGPFRDKRARQIVESEIRSGLITYLGPVFDANKEAFFNSIDVFFFPSRYRNEAEPLVLYEALARGIPVVAPEIGCIAEMVGSGYAGLVRSADLAGSSVEIISDLAQPCGALKNLSECSQRQFHIKRAKAVFELQVFLRLFTEG